MRRNIPAGLGLRTTQRTAAVRHGAVSSPRRRARAVARRPHQPTARVIIIGDVADALSFLASQRADRLTALGRTFRASAARWGMEIESLAAALEREHREIDEGIEAFTVDPGSAVRDLRPLAAAIRALRRHIYLEETLLFPPLYEAGLVAPVIVMLREHGQIWATLDALEGQLHTGAPEDIEPALCRQLSVQLLHHNLKEEKILYPQADQVLSAPVTAQLRDSLDSGELPDGWVCQRAHR